MEIDIRLNAANHLGGCGCPEHYKSKGEVMVQKILDDIQVNYIPQKSLPDCRHINPLRFDFVLFDGEKVIGAIEYNGQQHYQPVNIFGGEESFEVTILRDSIKKAYCESRNIPLLVIPHWKKNLSEMVTEFCTKYCYEYNN